MRIISSVWAARRGLGRIGLVFVWLAAAAVLAGCARRYDMILTNGQRLTNIRKPTLHPEGGYYSFVDATGRTNLIARGRVVEIGSHEHSPFTSPQ